MKNRKLIYILIPLVLLVWGLIIYKVFNKIGSADGPQTMQQQILPDKNAQQTLSDTFKLNLNYRDPFLGDLNRRSGIRSVSAEHVVVTKTASVKSAGKIWPSIVYGGLIKNQKSNKQFVFVQINGQVNIMKEGDIINEVAVTKVFRDSIEVLYDKQKKFIAK